MWTDWVSRLFLSSMALAGGSAGCSDRTGPPAAPDFSVQTCPRLNTADFDCSPLNCGGNSPTVNGFPINGFSKDGQGECNVGGVQLIPHSLQGGHCGSGADLGLDRTGTRLVGTRLGKVVCAGEELTGATFIVRSFARATLTFAIAGVRQIAMLDGRNRYEGYRIESSGGSACEPAAALRIQRQLGLVRETAAPAAALPTPAGYQFGPHDDLVIALDGPLYDNRDRLVVGSRTHWFNLACAGDALAKRTLYGLYAAGDDASNETALRMLTANYCGRPYTVPGIELAWEQATGADSRPQLEEALWHAGKAICIGTPRLMALQAVDGNQPLSPAELPARLQPSGCEAHNCDANSWTLALRAECDLPSCSTISRTPPPQFEFDSFDFEGDRNHIVVARH
jgi:hypothetical protein